MFLVAVTSITLVPVPILAHLVCNSSLLTRLPTFILPPTPSPQSIAHRRARLNFLKQKWALSVLCSELSNGCLTPSKSKVLITPSRPDVMWSPPVSLPPPHPLYPATLPSLLFLELVSTPGSRGPSALGNSAPR